MNKPPTNKGRKMTKIGALTSANLMLCMLEGTYTARQLAEKTGLHYGSVIRYAAALYKVGACHICGWEEDAQGRSVIRVYQLGFGDDMKQPKLSSVEKSQRYRDKQLHKKMLFRMAA
jgi:hypothetical protein